MSFFPKMKSFFSNLFFISLSLLAAGNIHADSSMPKIIHLSDIHIGSKTCGPPPLYRGSCEKEFNKLAAKLNRLIDGSNEYIVVITGDIANNYQHINAAKQTMKKLNIDEKRILIIPGNHDLKKNADTKEEKEKYEGKYKVCDGYFTNFKDVFYDVKNKKVSYNEHRINSFCDVAFIGFNSMAKDWGDECWKYNADGGLESDQVGEKLENALKDPRVIDHKNIVIYTHHPPSSEEREALIATIKDYPVSWVLFGHKHDGETKKEWIDQMPKFHNAASTTGDGWGKEKTQIEVIDLNTNEVVPLRTLLK